MICRFTGNPGACKLVVVRVVVLVTVSFSVMLLIVHVPPSLNWGRSWYLARRHWAVCCPSTSRTQTALASFVRRTDSRTHAG